MAEFVASLGIACDVEAPSYVYSGPGGYDVRVERKLLSALYDLLELTPLVMCGTDASAQVTAGRLAREGIPCVLDNLPQQRVAVPIINPSAEPGARWLYVPAEFLRAAQKLLAEPPISDAELTELALRTLVDPNDPP
jgi:hypothetical protein